MGPLAHGRGAMRRNAERRVGVGFSRVGGVANGTSPVRRPVAGPVATPTGGVGLIAGSQSKPGVWEVSQWEARQSGDRRTATVLPAPSRTAHVSDTDAYHSEGSYWCDPTQWDRKIRQAYPSHHIIRPVAPVGASVGPVPPVCHPTHDDAPHKRSHLGRSGPQNSNGSAPSAHVRSSLRLWRDA